MFARELVAGLNHLLSGAIWAQTHLLPFAEKRLLFEMTPFRLGLSVTSAGMFQCDTLADPPDVTFSLPANTPFLLIEGMDKVIAATTVVGNAEFANALSFVLRNLRWDLEEDLSTFVGDMAAHRLVTDISRFANWQNQSCRHMAENLAEYLAHERHLLVSAEEFARFRHEITQLTTKTLLLAKLISNSTL